MDSRVDWQTTVEKLTKQYGKGGKIRPISLLPWRRWLLKHLVIWVIQHAIAGHENCDFRRYLDCVPPDTPLRDIVDRCRVWESHGNTETRRVSKPMPEAVYPTYVVEQPDYETEPVCVVSVNKPNSQVDQSEELLKKLLEALTPAAPPPVRAPDVTPLEKLAQLLLSETAKRVPV